MYHCVKYNDFGNHLHIKYIFAQPTPVKKIYHAINICCEKLHCEIEQFNKIIKFGMKSNNTNSKSELTLHKSYSTKELRFIHAESL